MSAEFVRIGKDISIQQAENSPATGPIKLKQRAHSTGARGRMMIPPSVPRAKGIIGMVIPITTRPTSANASMIRGMITRPPAMASARASGFNF